MVSKGVPEMDGSRAYAPAASAGGDADRLARRDLLILRLEAARRRRRASQQAAARGRTAALPDRLTG